MKKTTLIKLLSCIICVVLIAAMALIATSCSDNSEAEKDSKAESTVTDKTNDTADDEASNVLGEGDTQFTFVVRDGNGNESSFEIKTDKTVVGDALLEHDLIEGEDGDFGLYVKTVNGITADYDIDGTYWAFYIDGEYAMTGVDQTDITDGATYMFAVEG